MGKKKINPLDQWYAKAIIRVILADQNINEEELKLFNFEKSLQQVSVSPHLKETIHQILVRSLPLDLKKFPGNREEACTILFSLATITVIGSSVENREKDIFFQLGRLLEFPDSFLVEVLDWAECSQKMVETENRLREMAYDYFAPAEEGKRSNPQSKIAFVKEAAGLLLHPTLKPFRVRIYLAPENEQEMLWALDALLQLVKIVTKDEKTASSKKNFFIYEVARLLGFRDMFATKVFQMGYDYLTYKILGVSLRQKAVSQKRKE